MPVYQPGSGPRRPVSTEGASATAAAQPTVTITIDGKTHQTFVSPVILDRHGRPVEGRTVTASIHAAGQVAPIHATLSRTCAPAGQGRVTATFAARALELYLSRYAARTVLVRYSAPGLESVDQVATVEVES